MITANHTLFNTLPSFGFAPMPHLHFGWGIRHQLIEKLQQETPRKLVVITGKTLAQTGQFGHIFITSFNNDCQLKHFTISGEPSPDIVDEIARQCDTDTDYVIAIGGGSVLDAGKAIAGLIPSQTSVMDYLEGVGNGKPFHVETTPFIAVPTTAGTGSETTKNAVLSRIGQFKKSFRDNKLLAKEAWLDPELLTSCPQAVLYATGMDAFTQLLESYTTRKPNPITDALAWQGILLFFHAFDDIESEDFSRQQSGYARLMLAATLSGTTLANAGLGAVHGLAGPIGAYFEAPHGIVCARLLAPVTEQNILSLQKENGDDAKQTLRKYAQVGELFSPSHSDPLTALITVLNQLAQRYAPQGLAEFGLAEGNIKRVIENCRSGSMLGNPITLSDEQLRNCILQAL